MSMSNSRAKPLRSRWEYRFYSVLLFPFFFALTLLGRAFHRGYADDVRTHRNIFSETVSALNGSVLWSFMGR